MALRSDGARTKKRILSACAKLFLEHGYQGTTMQQIYREADISSSSFQHLFGNKDGVLMELMQFMYARQFDMARNAVGETGANLTPVQFYALETSLQLAIVELSENLRELYVETYTCAETLGFIQRAMAGELRRTFGPYQPELADEDFHALDLGSSGLMRAYMARPCDDGFPLEQKLRAFLSLTLRGFRVPEDEVQQAVTLVLGLDLHAIARQVVETAVRALAEHFEFSAEEVLAGGERES